MYNQLLFRFCHVPINSPNYLRRHLSSSIFFHQHKTADFCTDKSTDVGCKHMSNLWVEKTKYSVFLDIILVCWRRK